VFRPRQAKSPDGDPIVVTIGPQGLSVLEAMTAGSNSGTVKFHCGNLIHVATRNPIGRKRYRTSSTLCQQI